MIKRVAIPVEQGNLACQFGICHHYLLFTVLSNGKIEREMLTTKLDNTDELLKWLSSNGVTDIIANKIDDKLSRTFIENKMNVFTGIPILSPDELFDKYLNGMLVSKEDF